MESVYTPMVPATLLKGEEEADGGEDDDYADVKKRLFGSIEKPLKRENVGSPKKQPVVVYLRVRPKSQLEIQNKDPECLHRLDENEVLAMAPPNSQTYRNKTGLRSEGNQKFIFSKVFCPETTQKDLFDEALMPTLRDFFDGQNCLVFTYGVTNSGMVCPIQHNHPLYSRFDSIGAPIRAMSEHGRDQPCTEPINVYNNSLYM